MQQLRKEPVMVYFFNFKSSYLSFGLKFRYMYILMAQVLPGMQNKLSKSKNLALEPMHGWASGELPRMC